MNAEQKAAAIAKDAAAEQERRQRFEARRQQRMGPGKMAHLPAAQAPAVPVAPAETARRRSRETRHRRRPKATGGPIGATCPQPSDAIRCSTAPRPSNGRNVPPIGRTWRLSGQRWASLPGPSARHAGRPILQILQFHPPLSFHRRQYERPSSLVQQRLGYVLEDVVSQQSARDAALHANPRFVVLNSAVLDQGVGHEAADANRGVVFATVAAEYCAADQRPRLPAGISS